MDELREVVLYQRAEQLSCEDTMVIPRRAPTPPQGLLEVFLEGAMPEWV